LKGAAFRPYGKKCEQVWLQPLRERSSAAEAVLIPNNLMYGLKPALFQPGRVDPD
jgi:hypothetical protein